MIEPVPIKQSEFVPASANAGANAGNATGQARERQAGAAPASSEDDSSVKGMIESSSSWYSSLFGSLPKLPEDCFDKALKAFGAVTVLIAGLQYFDSIRKEEVSKTLELIAIWEQGDLQKSYAKIADRIETINERSAAVLANATSLAEKRFYHYRVGDQLIRPADDISSLKPEVEAVFGFLDRVGFCVKHRICSQTVAVEYFGHAATSMFEYFGGFVNSRRRSIVSFAQASEHISQIKPQEPR